MITITVSLDNLELALNCLDACASPNSKEPQRYKEWYTEAAEEIRAAIAVSTPTSS